MMKPPKNIFVGHCNRCGESYEAQTSLEDLEGVRFQCKKMVCEGKVELHYTGSEDAFSRSADPSPRRYC